MSSILDGASETDLKRMATLWLYSDMSATNWEAAHTAYDPDKNTQLASFKTVSNRSLSKYKKAVLDGATANGATGSQGGGEKTGKPVKAAGKKRKRAIEVKDENEDGEEVVIKKPKATAKPRAKKGAKKSATAAAAAAEEVTAEEDDEAGETEAEDDA